MTISKEQVADLRPGDVVRIVEVSQDGSRYVHEGPVRADGGNALEFAGLWVRSNGGDAPDWVHELTVISRALYINHPRTKPVLGDIVRDADDDSSTTTWSPSAITHGEWWENRNGDNLIRAELPTRLRLLVDGTTGQVVP